MKSKHLWAAAFCFLGAVSATQMACVRDSMTAPAPNYAGGGNNGGGSNPTPTPTTPAGPATFTVSTNTSGSSASGYIYTASGGTNGTGGLLTFTAHVGDVIILPGSSFHPLYFDNGTTTCIYTASTSTQTYTFSSAGTYYFHCGNHATGCSTGNGACGSTNCTSMAGMVTVS